MITSLTAINLIKKYEPFSEKPHNCFRGYTTIGYGHKFHDGPTTTNDDRIIWSQEYADIVLRLDTTIIEQEINDRIKVPLNQNQFDALVSFIFDIGVEKLNENNGVWLRELKNGNYSVVPEEMKRNDDGFSNRRNEEIELFLKSYPEH